VHKQALAQVLTQRPPPPPPGLCLTIFFCLEIKDRWQRVDWGAVSCLTGVHHHALVATSGHNVRSRSQLTHNPWQPVTENPGEDILQRSRLTCLDRPDFVLRCHLLLLAEMTPLPLVEGSMLTSCLLRKTMIGLETRGVLLCWEVRVTEACLQTFWKSCIVLKIDKLKLNCLINHK